MQPLVFAKVASWNVGRSESAILIDLANKVQIPNTYVACCNIGRKTTTNEAC